MKPLIAGIAALALVGAAAFALVYSGAFDVAADEPHSAPVHRLLEAVRTRSIAVRSAGIEVPPLDAPGLVQAGAAHYAAMCTGCHLAPGKEASELRSGMYPQPPDLTQHAHASPAESFWIIKHGIKMSGMPAWGATHDDESIWSLVAFLQVLPELSPEEYRKLAPKSTGRDADRHGTHSHDAGHGGATGPTGSKSHAHEHSGR
jgi:mono/diheme cytochrome c family protein